MSQPTGAPLPSDGGDRQPPADLGSRVRRGARATLVGQTVVQLGSIVTTMVLARLLTPAEFGLVAITQSIMGAAALVSLGGITASLVSWKGPVERLASTYFWLALLVGGAVVSTVALVAEPISGAMGQPQAADYLRVLTLSFPITLVSLVPAALLQRNMRFSALNWNLLLSSAVYFTVEIVLAWNGWGAWSVVIGQVAGASVGLVGVLTAARWRPSMHFSRGELRRDAAVLGGVTVSRGLAYLQKNIDYWVVSRSLGGAALGQYYVAYVLPNIARLRLSEVFRTTMLPAIASHDDHAKAALAWRRAAVFLFGLGIPGLSILIGLSEPIVLTFFGPQWQSAVVPMQLIAIGAAADLMVQAVGAMSVARRQVGRHNLVLAARAVITAAAVMGAAAINPTLLNVATAVAVAAWLTIPIQDFVVSRRMGIGVRTLIQPVATFFALSVLMVSVLLVSLPTWMQDLGPVIQLVVGVPLALVIYAVAGLTLAPRTMKQLLRDAHSVVRGR